MLFRVNNAKNTYTKRLWGFELQLLTRLGSTKFYIPSPVTNGKVFKLINLVRFSGTFSFSKILPQGAFLSILWLKCFNYKCAPQSCN